MDVAQFASGLEDGLAFVQDVRFCKASSPGEGSRRKPGCVISWQMEFFSREFPSLVERPPEILDTSVNLQMAGNSKLGLTKALRCFLDKSHTHFWIFSLILLSVTNASNGF